MVEGTDATKLPRLLDLVARMGGVVEVLRMLGDSESSATVTTTPAAPGQDVQMLPQQISLLRSLRMCEQRWDLWQWRELMRVTKTYGGAQSLVDRISRLETAMSRCRVCREWGFSVARGQAQGFASSPGGKRAHRGLPVKGVTGLAVPPSSLAGSPGGVGSKTAQSAAFAAAVMGGNSGAEVLHHGAFTLPTDHGGNYSTSYSVTRSFSESSLVNVGGMQLGQPPPRGGNYTKASPMLPAI